MNKLLHNEVFDFDVVVSINDTDIKFYEFLTKHGLNDIDSYIESIGNTEDIGRVTYIESRACVILRVSRKPVKIEDYATLNHEINHLVNFLCDYIDTPLSAETREVYAYLTGYYTKEIYKLFRK